MKATTTWYRVSSFGNSITPIDVIKETEKTLVIKIERAFIGQKELRVQKHSTFDKYFETWQEAHEHKLRMAENEVNAYQARLDRARRELAEIKAMKPI